MIIDGGGPDTSNPGTYTSPELLKSKRNSVSYKSKWEEEVKEKNHHRKWSLIWKLLSCALIAGYLAGLIVAMTTK
jgi:hypothetical protein